jgi:ABC-type nitrate/sulfonate/bicarbonate transport system permease component
LISTTLRTLGTAVGGWTVGVFVGIAVGLLLEHRGFSSRSGRKVEIIVADLGDPADLGRLRLFPEF